MNLKRWQENGIILGLLILIFPFFGLLLYVYPQSDDFFFAVKVNELGILPFVKYTYLFWSGRYTSMLLGAIDPTTFNSILLLRIELFIFMIINFLSIFLLAKSILKPSLSFKRIFLLSLIFYTILLNAIPDIFEFIYWYPSVTAYLLGLSLFLIFISNMIFVETRRLNPRTYLLINILLSIITVGLLELFIVPIVISLLINIYSTKYRNKKSNKNEVIIFIFTVVAAIIVVAAPGNFVRMQVESPMSIIIGIYLALKSMVYLLGYIFQNPIFILASILFLSLPFKQVFGSPILNFNLIKLHPIWSALLLLFVPLIVILPSTLALGQLPPGRVFNGATFFFYLLWIYSLINFKLYYKNKISFDMSIFYQKTISVFIIMFIFSGIYVINPYEFSQKKKDSVLLNGNILNAYKTLLFDADSFDKDMQKRIAYFKDAQQNNNKTLILKPLEHTSEMLLFVDITDKSEYGTWIFNWKAKYYGIDSIYIDNNDTTIIEKISQEINNKTIEESK